MLLLSLVSLVLPLSPPLTLPTLEPFVQLISTFVSSFRPKCPAPDFVISKTATPSLVIDCGISTSSIISPVFT